MPRLSCVGNIFTGKSIDNQDIIAPPRSLHERQSITYMTYDIPWQAKIELCQLNETGSISTIETRLPLAPAWCRECRRRSRS
jgi:hypothetical protein